MGACASNTVQPLLEPATATAAATHDQATTTSPTTTTATATTTIPVTGTCSGLAKHNADRCLFALYMCAIGATVLVTTNCINGTFEISDVQPFPAPPGQELKDGVSDHAEIVFFLSHRGPDTKEILVRPLSFILRQLGIPHFFDQSDDSMKLGKTNGDQMASAAWHCRVGVVILSAHFADSKWCLRELNTFLHRRQLKLQEQKDASNPQADVLLPVHFGETLYRFVV